MRFQITILLVISSFISAIAQYPSTSRVNYIREWTPNTPISDASLVPSRVVEEVRTLTSYLDGLGRPIQTVLKQESTTKKDKVKFNLYDNYGRESLQYLSFISTQTPGGTEIINDGNFKMDPLQQQQLFMSTAFQNQGEDFFFSQTDYENSPLGRPQKSFAPGVNWVGTKGSMVERSVEQQYFLNTALDSVNIFSVNLALRSIPTNDGFYPAGVLIKNITIDENGKTVVEFKDKNGRVVLKKVQLAGNPGNGYTGWLSTFYIYDDLGRLRFVIPPKATDLYLGGTNLSIFVNELCFFYDYDSRNRMIIKKVPGAAEVSMVYDARDRLIMTRDGNLTTTGKWLVTEYDALNRPKRTGLFNDSHDYAYHASLAENSINYPAPSPGSGYEVLTENYYDDYTWVSGSGTSLSSSIDPTYLTNGSYFVTTYNIAPYFSLPLSVNYGTRGLSTGSKVKVLGTSSQYLYTVMFYDDRNRPIQVQSINASGGKDIITTQYDFSGKPLRNLLQHQKNGSNAQSHLVLTKMDYDHAGRLLTIKKSVNSNIGTATVVVPEKTIVQNSYDELGQLKTKKIGTKPGSTSELETLNYDYNIRGWMLGMNRDFVKDVNSTNYFGFDLGYDKPASLISGTNYANPQYNGNIEGTIWKSKGDNEKRKYDFIYDNVNRLTGANFTENLPGDVTPNVNFNVENLTYDANGNILTMRQKGLKLNTSEFIDKLLYNYTLNSNKLLNVIDSANEATTKLGDFRASTLYQLAVPVKNSTTVDYTYDVNGNMVIDKNKDIFSASSNGIVYNHLNLPQSINVTAKGTIVYTYDAAGNKLRKLTTDNTVSPAKITSTDYINGFVYENDVLQFIPHEEGRIRFIPAVGTGQPSFAFDYFVKDHLGNVRMMLTEEQQQDIYPAATLEPSLINTESNYYTIDQSKLSLKSSIAGMQNINYPNNNGIQNNNPACGSGTLCTTDNSTKLYRLNSNEAKTGLGITLKVMAGDKLDVLGKSYYFQNNPGSSYNNNLPIIDLLTAFLNAPTAGATAIHGIVTPYAINTPAGVAGINSMMSQQNSQSQSSPLKPRAFVNVIFFDEQFNAVDFRVSMVGDNSALKEHFPDLQNLTVPKNGFVYIYCSNETPVDVFFDNIQVVHTRGPILEETHYYPFGLTMAGISSTAAGGLENRRKYNGIEFENDFDLNAYDAFFRELDPQTGRWREIDPQVDNFYEWSPYASNYDNPIKFKDSLGDEGEKCCKGLWEALRGSADDIMISASGVLWGGLNTVTGGLVSTDPFNVRERLNSQEQMLYDNSVTVGQIAPLLSPGSVKSPINGTVEFVPAGGAPKITIPIQAPSTPLPVFVPPATPTSPNSNPKNSNSNQQIKGERNRTGNASGTDNPYKKLKPDPNKYGNVIVKDANGKTISKKEPEGFAEFWKKKHGN